MTGRLMVAIDVSASSSDRCRRCDFTTRKEKDSHDGRGSGKLWRAVALRSPYLGDRRICMAKTNSRGRARSKLKCTVASRSVRHADAVNIAFSVTMTRLQRAFYSHSSSSRLAKVPTKATTPRNAMKKGDRLCRQFALSKQMQFFYSRLPWINSICSTCNRFDCAKYLSLKVLIALFFL